MSKPEMIELIKADPNIFRTFLFARKLYKKRSAEGINSPLVDQTINVTLQLLMLYLHTNIETAEELLVTAIDGVSGAIRILPDQRRAFLKLMSEYKTAKEFADAAGITESLISLMKSGKRRITTDRMIEICKRCGRKYILE